MKTRIFLILGTILVLAIGVVMSIKYKSEIPSLIPSDQNLSDMPVSVRKMAFEGVRSNNPDTLGSDSNASQYPIPTLDDLLANAKVIAIVTPSGNREMKSNDILSEAKIEKVLVGGGAVQTGDLIYIYESLHINYIKLTGSTALFPNQDRLDYRGVANILQRNKKYIVFLKPFAYPAGYKCSKKEASSFIYVDRYFGQFPYSLNSYIIKGEDETNNLTYKDVMKYDCITENIDSYEAYKNLQNAVLDHFNITQNK